MAQRTVVTFEDDIDGSAAEGTVTFALNGVQYDIDLSKKNSDKLAKALAPYVASARKVSSRASARSAPAGSRQKKHDQSAVREWARAQGMTISDRGRLAADVLAKYDAAH
ncbi:MAG TPA: Lsr2 family protein [Streptosporangiaceae bacterium]